MKNLFSTNVTDCDTVLTPESFRKFLELADRRFPWHNRRGAQISGR